MGKRKVLIFWCVLVIGSLLLVGCWNYREINTFAIVLGFAVDKSPAGGYVVTVEIMNPELQGRDSQMTPVVLWMEGESIFDAVRNLVTRAGKKLYWSHAKIVIVSEEVAREGVMPVLDWVYRDQEVRPDITLLIADGCPARDILLSQARIASSVSMQLNTVFRAEMVVNQFVVTELWELMRKVSKEGVMGMSATVQVIEQEGSKFPQIYGTALFRNGKMVGWLNGEESRMASWLGGIAQRGLIIQKERAGGNIVHEIKNSSTKYTAVYVDDELSFDIEIKAETHISELNRTNPDYSNEAVLEQLETNLNKYLEYRIMSVMKKAQKEYRTDIFGLGAKVKNQLPEVWRQIHNRWGEIYPEVPVRVSVDAEITGTALMSKPIYVED